jgi:predicted transcriptional regulator
VIKLNQKQRIILKHIDGMSNRSIASELHMSKDTVNKYVAEYEQKKQELLANNPEADTKELIHAIVEKHGKNHNAEFHVAVPYKKNKQFKNSKLFILANKRNGTLDNKYHIKYGVNVRLTNLNSFFLNVLQLSVLLCVIPAITKNSGT